MRPTRLLIALVIVLCSMSIPVLAATSTSTATSTSALAEACDTTPTGGWAPRHPYLGEQAASFFAQNPAYRYGENPYVYTLFVPEGLPEGPAPLVLGLHGLGHSARNFEAKGLEELANRKKVIIALPSGARSWYATEDGHDIEFLRDVVADVRASRCVDGQRIYAMGASNGGFMAQRVACDAGDIFAAIYVHAGTAVDETYPFGGPCLANEDGAQGFETVPVRFSHGELDETVDFGVGRKNLRHWVDRYRCDSAPLEVTPTEWGNLERYGNCNRPDIAAREQATGQPFVIEWWTLDGHGHLYPDGCGGAETCESPGTQFPSPDVVNDAMYDFLARNARATPAAPQPKPSLADMPMRDPERHADWLTQNPEADPAPMAVFVDDLGAPVSTTEAIAQETVLVEFASYASDTYRQEIIENHPVCPSVAPGSRKIRIVGRAVTLRVTDATGTKTYESVTVEQEGTGLSVAPFTITAPAAGRVIVEATIDRDQIASPAVCTSHGARFQETLQLA